jgi:signal transduction histidine kinase
MLLSLILGAATRGAEGAIGAEELVLLVLAFGAAAILPATLTASGRRDHEATLDLLRRANAALTSLRQIAQDLPATFDPGLVASAIIREVLGIVGGTGALLFAQSEGRLALLGSFGLDPPEGLVLSAPRRWQDLREPSFVSPGDIPEQLGRELPSLDGWLLLPIRHQERLLAIVLAGPVRGGRLDHEQREKLRHDELLWGAALNGALLFREMRLLVAGEERRRAARDLHDGVAQLLLHLRLDLEHLAGSEGIPEPTRKELARLTRVAGEALEETRELVRALVGPDSRGLPSALMEGLRDLEGERGPRVHFLFRSSPVLGPETVDAIVRIVREAVSNAKQHSGATQVIVHVEQAEGALRVIVDDNGNPNLPPSASRAVDGYRVRDAEEAEPSRGTGLGLESMTRRAAALGGEIEVSPSPFGGTRVALRVPLRR